MQNAELNRINQYTPYGNSIYTVVGHNPDGTPIYNQSIQLSPQEQQVFNNNITGQIGQGGIALGMQNQVANSYTNPIDTSGIPQITGQISNQSTPELVRQAQDAAYRTQAQYLDPRFQQQQAKLENQDANMGIVRGSNAWNTDQQNLNLAKQQAYQSAADAAVQAGNQEQATLYQQAAQQASLQNAASQQGMQQLFALRNQPLNEYNALMTGAQVQQPTFQAVPNASVANTDVAGIYQNNFQDQMAAYQAKAAANPLNSIFSLGGSLGSAAILAG